MCEERLRANILKFLDDIITVVPDDMELKIYRSLLESVPSKLVFDNFMECVYPYKDQIVRKDERFFLESDGFLFGPVAATRYGKFSDMWRKRLDEEEKKTVWKWFNFLVLLCESHKKIS
jgi:hypothetical protein